MGLFDNLAQALSQKHLLHPDAAKGAIACVVKAHAGDPAALRTIQHAAKASNGRLLNVLGDAYAVLKKQPSFWTSHYAAKAAAQPLHPSHPYAAHIAGALARIGAPALPPVMAAGRGHGGGGHHGGHGGGARGHVQRFRHAEAEAFGGTDWGGPYGYGTEYILLDREKMDNADSPGDLGPDHADGRTTNPGGN